MGHNTEIIADNSTPVVMNVSSIENIHGVVSETTETPEPSFDKIKHLLSDEPLRFNRPKQAS